MPNYIKRADLTSALREALDESGLTQGELANKMSKNTTLKVRGTHVSRALREESGEMDYLREAMAEELLGGSWSRDIMFWKE